MIPSRTHSGKYPVLTDHLLQRTTLWDNSSLTGKKIFVIKTVVIWNSAKRMEEKHENLHHPDALCVLTTSNLLAALLDPMAYEPKEWPSGLEITTFTIDPDSLTMTDSITLRKYGRFRVWQPQANGQSIAVFCFKNITCHVWWIEVNDSDHPVAILSQGDLILRGAVWMGYGNEGTGREEMGIRVSGSTLIRSRIVNWTCISCRRRGWWRIAGSGGKGGKNGLCLFLQRETLW